MRNTKFRGRRAKGDWVYGCLVYSDSLCPAIYFEKGTGAVKEMDFIYVKKETVGELTEIPDKNGGEIFEGDQMIVLGRTCTVIMVKGCWCLTGGKWENPGISKDKDASELYLWANGSEVMGNIHEPPDLTHP